MRKLFLSMALILSAGLWAQCVITYTATGAFVLESDAFDVGLDTHSYDPDTKKGTISFSSDVTEIRAGAFKGFSALLSIDLPNTVIMIGNDAFNTCNNLTAINIPNNVTTIGMGAFSLCSKLTSITIPSAVTKIGSGAFGGCTGLTAVTFEGTSCQNALGTNVFNNVGSAEKPVTLVLPNDWNYDAAPTNNTTAWYGGIFNSNIYAEQEETEKQAAIDEVTAILGNYATTSPYLQSLLAEETEKINSAVNRPQLNERKQASIDRLTFAVDSYAASLSEAQENLPTDPEVTKGSAVVVTKGEKSVTLINPDKVEYITLP